MKTRKKNTHKKNKKKINLQKTKWKSQNHAHLKTADGHQPIKGTNQKNEIVHDQEKNRNKDVGEEDIIDMGQGLEKNVEKTMM